MTTQQQIIAPDWWMEPFNDPVCIDCGRWEKDLIDGITCRQCAQPEPKTEQQLGLDV